MRDYASTHSTDIIVNVWAYCPILGSESTSKYNYFFQVCLLVRTPIGIRTLTWYQVSGLPELVDIIQEHLVDGGKAEVCEIGSEKLRYLVAIKFVITKHSVKTIDASVG